MRVLDKVRLRLRSLILRSEVERELEDELRFHLDQQIEENIASGMTPEDARTACNRADMTRVSASDTTMPSATPAPVSSVDIQAKLGPGGRRGFAAVCLQPCVCRL